MEQAWSFQPHREARAWDCRTCRYWSITELAPDHVWCLRHLLVIGLPEQGCGCYEREPGCDDESDNGK